MKLKVHLMRAGAPDKFGLELLSDKYEYVKHDNCNLRTLSKEMMDEMLGDTNYILPADEVDILVANLAFDRGGGDDQSRILLPQMVDEDGYYRVIPYYEYVPKDSHIYEKLAKSDEFFNYPKYKSYTISQFEDAIKTVDRNKMVVKTTTGSGSRGVWVVDKERIHLGGKCISEFTKTQYDSIIQFAKSEGCDIMIQDLCDINLLKCNTDFVIKGGELLGYKWDIVNQNQQFTNWDNGHFFRNEYTDKVMEYVTELLVEEGIENAIMNFESYSDCNSRTELVEFNWRYSNSMFETNNSLGIDLIACYLEDKEFEIPVGEHKFVRHWTCSLYDKTDIINHKVK